MSQENENFKLFSEDLKEIIKEVVETDVLPKLEQLIHEQILRSIKEVKREENEQRKIAEEKQRIQQERNKEGYEKMMHNFFGEEY